MKENTFAQIANPTSFDSMKIRFVKIDSSIERWRRSATLNTA